MEDSVRRLASALAGQPDLLDAAVDAARGNSPQVAALPREETVRHTRAVMLAATTAFAEGRQPTDAEFRVAADLGADRASQSVSIAALLDGFQAARTTVMRRLIGVLRDRGIDGDTLVDAFIELDEVITALERQVTHAHRTTELEMARTARDQRALLLRGLLTEGETVDPAALRALHLDPAGALHCVVSAEHHARAAHRLEADLVAAVPGVFGLVNGFLVGVSTQSPPDSGSLLVVGPAVPRDRLPRVYALCCAARDTGVRQGLVGVRPLASLAVETTVDTQAELGALLADTALSALDPTDAFHRELAETALAHLDHGGRIEATAAALHVHPNTVKYRLRRLRDLTGQPSAPEPGRAIAHTTTWWWALRTWTTR
ncbi:PucR family transcriptional regulator [Actinokineospora sp.]|uniref:PucR family transcriptional regulator n=1 Tax=Actinokineospora sp. TaxID=1872133 RepID=UPI004037B3FA